MAEEQPTTILIIDDDRLLQELFQIAFSQAGFNVLQAYDGDEGLQLLEGHPEIKVALVDIMLPRLSGYDVINKIRTEALNRDIPVIALSALADAASREKGLKAGANEFITKGELPLAGVIDQVKRYAEPLTV